MPNPAPSPELPHHLQAQKTIRRQYSRRDFLEPGQDLDDVDTLSERSADEDLRGPVPVLDAPETDKPIRVAASIGPYPIHSMLVPIAIGNFFFSFASDLVYLVTGHPHPWNVLAFYTLVAGTLVALVAAVPGLLDFASLPEGKARDIARIHMRINLVALATCIVNGAIRYTGPASLEWPILLSTLTIMMLSISAWLGAKLVAQAGVGLDPTGAEMAEEQMAHVGRHPRPS